MPVPSETPIDLALRLRLRAGLRYPVLRDCFLWLFVLPSQPETSSHADTEATPFHHGLIQNKTGRQRDRFLNHKSADLLWLWRMQRLQLLGCELSNLAGRIFLLHLLVELAGFQRLVIGLVQACQLVLGGGLAH